MQRQCFQCRYHALGQPCKNDPIILAQAFVEGDAWGNGGGRHWAWDCMHDATKTNPELAFDTIVQLVPRIETTQQAGVLAAGHLEDLLVEDGEKFIDQIEDLSRNSDRFSYLISGVWLPDDATSEFWTRIKSIQDAGPHMDTTFELPDI